MQMQKRRSQAGATYSSETEKRVRYLLCLKVKIRFKSKLWVKAGCDHPTWSRNVIERTLSG